MLKIKDLTIKLKSVDTTKTSENKTKSIIKKASLDIIPGKIYLLTGSNGAGKSTLVKGVLGHPDLTTEGIINIDGKDISNLSTSDKAKEGIFLSFQQPPEVEGVRFIDFARESYNRTHDPKNAIDIYTFTEKFSEYIKKVGFNNNHEAITDYKDDEHDLIDYETRELNVGFSGGERKKSELLQLVLLKPRYALLDELDTGLDKESLNTMYKIILELATENNTGFLIITHRQDIKEYLPIEKEYYLKNGQISSK